MSVLLASSPDGEPVLLHWGHDLGATTGEAFTAYAELRTPGVPHSALDHPRWSGLIAGATTGFTGTPSVEVLRDRTDGAWSPRWQDWQWGHEDDGVVLSARDPEVGVSLTTRLEVTEEGLVRQRHQLSNEAADDLVVLAARTTLPVPASASELLDLTGRWCRERVPQRHPLTQGTYLRQGRHGRTGHDATLLLMAGRPGFGFRDGEVYGVHVAWSGDHATYAEATAEGEVLLGGHELIGPGEIRLRAGESYTTPWLVGAWSAAGIDGLSERLHAYVRRTNPRPAGVRPVVVNTWEATYFDHRLDRLTELADRAAEVGAERFVLDDGWFRGRRDDRAGLGDWAVDREVWPEGLHPLVAHVHELGLDFGLWVEPEMVNLDSDLVRDHPDWVLRGRDTLPPPWRHQQVLDLAHPDAYAYLRDALMSLLDEYPIAFLKWDHNRDLVDTGHAGRPTVHSQTTALYRLLDELRAAHPGVEIESCASGGGRIDLGILERTDRVWPSDTIDPVERQSIQRWTSLLVPAERIGSHVGSQIAHTTGRHTRLDFRAATALLWHFGIEQDLAAMSREERAELARWIAVHKQVRPLLSRGRLVRGDHPDPAIVVTGVVDGTEAAYVVATVGALATQSPTPVVLPGLDETATYALRVLAAAGPEHRVDLGDTWWSKQMGGSGDSSSLRVPGVALTRVGLRLPVLAPESAVVLGVSAVSQTPG